MTLYPKTFPIFLCLSVDVFHVKIWLLKTFVKPLEVERNLSNTILNIFAINREVAPRRIVSSVNWTLWGLDSGPEDCGPYPSLRWAFKEPVHIWVVVYLIIFSFWIASIDHFVLLVVPDILAFLGILWKSTHIHAILCIWKVVGRSPLPTHESSYPYKNWLPLKFLHLDLPPHIFLHRERVHLWVLHSQHNFLMNFQSVWT